MKALYFPYTSPRSRDTIFRSLLLYDEVGVISPKDFFLSESPGFPSTRDKTELERIAEECLEYTRRSPIFVLDPLDLLRNNEKLFTQAVIADMMNPTFLANAPRGSMVLYASKMTREIFEAFRERIRPVATSYGLSWDYREGPYCGAEHFVWNITEPLAHSILLNLTLLGVNQTGSVPITDSMESHRAFLFKVSGVDRVYNAHVAVERLMQLVLPSPKKVDTRTILEFRDRHRKELVAFWTALADEQEKLARQFDQGADQLYTETRIEFEKLKNAIKAARENFKWGLGGNLIQFFLGLAGPNPLMVASAVATTVLTAIRYVRTTRHRNVTGFSYLLHVAEEL